MPKVKKVQAELKSPHKPFGDKTVEQLVIENGTMVEDLYKSPVWSDILEPMMTEFVAGVSGRYTNGRWYHGTLTRDWTANTSIFVAGYQKGLMDLFNGLNDFVAKKRELEAKMIHQKKEEAAQVINPFMESLDDEAI